MISSFIGAIICFIFAFFCGYWAIDRAEHGSNSGDEYMAKQLVAGAWFFGVLCVFLLAFCALMEWSKTNAQIPTEQDS